jgi:hypothetical protein
MKIFIGLVITLQIVAQQRNFDVVLLGKVIGESSIIKKQDGKGWITYQLESKTAVDVMFQQRTNATSFDVKYYSGRLYSSVCKVINNGIQTVTEIVNDAEGYLVKTGDEIKRVKEPVTYLSSSMELYFSEPTQQKKVFSERIGEFVAFEKTAPGEYVNRLKDVTNIYRYKNGALYELEMRKPLGSVYLRAKN